MSTHVEQSNGTNGANPPAQVLPVIAAAFFVKFDDRKGYVLAWQKSEDKLDLEGVVEFKSMPSGLHNVSEDLVYFVHEDYAGVSAVLNIEDLEATRKARVIAVGVLVPLESGRMGKSWLYAEELKELAEKQIKKDNDYSVLEQFWDEHKDSSLSHPENIPNDPKKEGLTININLGPKANGYQKSRSMSTGTVSAATDYTLPVHHPALVLPEFLRLFGPLAFPLVRAALLRKRILLLGEAPVEQTCNFVYNLSILSSLPRPIATLLPHLDPVHFRLRPLFNIGISDIPLLESEAQSTGGWIACTTDDVLCTKPNLFDVLVILPSSAPAQTNSRTYPKIYPSSPELSRARPKNGLRASRRDAKRFATLWKGLQSIPRSNKQRKPVVDTSAIASSSETSPELPSKDDPAETASVSSSVSSTMSLKSVVEPQSWSRIAYTSLVWWASAGDQRSGLSEMEENENEQDISLLTGENIDEDEDGADEEARTREVACVQYFHRLSNLIFTAAGELIRRTEGYEQMYRDQAEEEQGAGQHQGQDGDEDSRALLPNRSGQNDRDDRAKIQITQEDIQSMGLDAWSASDQQFVEELFKFWWERDADVQGRRIECCGMRIL